MKTLFKNANLIGKKGETVRGIHVLTDREYISTVDRNIEKITDEPDRVINAENLLLIPGLYNMHSHLPMSCLKGYAEDMTLQNWLFNHIFPLCSSVILLAVARPIPKPALLNSKKPDLWE